MNRISRHPICCFIACFACVSHSLRSQVSSGGVVAAPSSVVDFTNTGQTIPARKLAADPASCTLGEYIDGAGRRLGFEREPVDLQQRLYHFRIASDIVAR